MLSYMLHMTLTYLLSRIIAIFDSMSNQDTFTEVCGVLQRWLVKVYKIPSARLNIRMVHVRVSIFPLFVLSYSLSPRSLSNKTLLTVVPLLCIMHKPFSLMLQPTPNTSWYALFCDLIAFQLTILYQRTDLNDVEVNELWKIENLPSLRSRFIQYIRDVEMEVQ